MKRLHLIALFMAILIVMLPICFASELSIRYDANGNVVYDGQFYREYNGLNQLYRIWNGSNTTAPIYQEYTYHPLEERVIEKKTFNSNGTLKERVIYWDPDYVTIINSSGSYNYEYIHAEGQLMAQINPDGSIYYMETDIKGDVVAVMNSTGAVIENTSYSPYGEVLTGGKATRFGYEAQEHDSVLGDTDFHARKYSPIMGVFLQPDSIIPNVYNPQQLNRYMFESGNPYRSIDPSGHCLEDACVVEVGFGFTVAEITVVSLAVVYVSSMIALVVGNEWMNVQAKQTGSYPGLTGNKYNNKKDWLDKELPRSGDEPFVDPSPNKRGGKPYKYDPKGNPIDADNNPWVPDRKEGHWDRQNPDGSHTRITPDGRVLGTVVSYDPESIMKKIDYDLKNRNNGLRLSASGSTFFEYVGSNGKIYPTNNPLWKPKSEESSSK